MVEETFTYWTLDIQELKKRIILNVTEICYYNVYSRNWSKYDIIVEVHDSRRLDEILYTNTRSSDYAIVKNYFDNFKLKHLAATLKQIERAFEETFEKIKHFDMNIIEFVIMPYLYD